MAAAELLRGLRQAGFDVTVADNRVVVRPASRLTDRQRLALLTHKTHVLALLVAPPADDRVKCTGCKFYRARLHRCARHRAAGLSTHEVGLDLAALPQRCPAHAARP
jgi:hypothetical protein